MDNDLNKQPVQNSIEKPAQESVEKAPENSEPEKPTDKKDKSFKIAKPKKAKSRVVSLVFFIVGLVVLAGGAAAFLIKTLKAPSVRDAEFLVSAGTWIEEDSESVIWTFTEIGKGTLTTNQHQNDYDFIWSMEGNQLKIQTDWLYDLYDTYTYTLNQGSKTLELTNSDGETITFKAQTPETVDIKTEAESENQPEAESTTEE